MKLSSSFVLLLVAFTVVAQLSHVARSEPPSDPYPVDCLEVFYGDLHGCLPFISDGGDLGKPGNGCCDGLKNVMKDGGDRARCVCELFHNSGQFGMALNETKTKTLPSACGDHKLSVDSCSSGSHPNKQAPVHTTPKPSLAPHYNHESPSSSPTLGRSSHRRSAPSPAPTPSESNDGTFPNDPTNGEVIHHAPAPAPKKSGASSVKSISVAALLASLAATSLAYL